MPVVRHGKMDLRWCHECRVPLIEGVNCPACGGKTHPVKYTPPGDIRPAFPHDMDQITSIADSQWGDGSGSGLSFENEPVLLNPCPSPDRLEEIICCGQVIGALAFSPERLSTSLILRKEGGELLRASGFRPGKGYVVADRSAIPFLLDGMNLLSPGIADCSDDITPGDEVLVVDSEMRIIGSGSARKVSNEMAGTRGMGVKMRWALPPLENEAVREASRKRGFSEIWDEVIRVNREPLGRKIKNSTRFIKKVVAKEEMEAAVSYSGGKDSLATLLLTQEAGFELPIMFINTGIEFPETVEHVHELADEMDLELIEGKPRSSFYDNIEKFGPPGRDYRWCCKSCKLGPTTELIRKRFPEGVLTFIGQRRFESDSRERKGSLWKNPWVPNQKGASPVQDWTALDVWLYIFGSKVKYNVLYEKGFQRIGCWLCPSCDLSEQELIEGTAIDPEPYEKLLETERKERGLPKEWTRFGFHRFKKLPPHMKELAEKLGITDGLKKKKRSRSGDGTVIFVDGYGSCIDGLSLEGYIDAVIEMDRLMSLLNIIGPVGKIEGTTGLEVRPDNWKMERAEIEIYDDGTLVLRGKDERGIEETKRKLISVLKRAEGCIGCMICVGRCPNSAMEVDHLNMVSIDPDRCLHCGACLGPCPAESYERDPYDI